MIKIFKLVITNIIVFLLIFGSLEIFFRLKFPEFKGHIFSQSKSMDINYIDGQFYGQIRSPNQMIVVLFVIHLFLYLAIQLAEDLALLMKIFGGENLKDC